MGSKPSQMFFCGRGRTTEAYKPTNGDEIRNMTDRQLAELINQMETDVYHHAQAGCRWNLGESNVKFYTGYLSTPADEDYYGPDKK
jgi:hypothetical protein